MIQITVQQITVQSAHYNINTIQPREISPRKTTTEIIRAAEIND